MSNVKRVFMPGSEWFYLKLYASEKISENILLKEISGILKKMYRNEMIEKWFFIRYNDPNPHLRLRILLKDKSHTNYLMELFHKHLANKLQHRVLWKIQVDTYFRELERYNKKHINDSETIFWIDSECILSILKVIKNKSEDYRWLAGLKLIDSFLNNFGYSIENKNELMQKMNKSFKEEFGFNEFNSKQFNKIYRNKKRNVESFIKGQYQDETSFSIYSIIERRSIRLMHPINLIIESSKRSPAYYDELLFSYIHMTMNRLFISNNRIYELLLYDIMNRYYMSEIAKVKYNVNK